MEVLDAFADEMYMETPPHTCIASALDLHKGDQVRQQRVVVGRMTPSERRGMSTRYGQQPGRFRRDAPWRKGTREGGGRGMFGVDEGHSSA